jgi:hypothetical protein
MDVAPFSVGDRVYHIRKGKHEIGCVMSVVDNTSVKVSWDESDVIALKPSAHTSLVKVSISAGMCVVRGSYGNSVPFISAPLSTPIGVVCTTDAENSSVMWDDSTTDIIANACLRDINHLPPITIDLSTKSLIEWTKDFALAHNIDFSKGRKTGHLLCKRVQHIKNSAHEHCSRCQVAGRIRRHKVAKECRCSFKMVIDHNNAFTFSGRHDFHCPGQYYVTFT